MMDLLKHKKVSVSLVVGIVECDYWLCVPSIMSIPVSANRMVPGFSNVPPGVYTGSARQTHFHVSSCLGEYATVLTQKAGSDFDLHHPPPLKKSRRMHSEILMKLSHFGKINSSVRTADPSAYGELLV
jgi:hypothetical protein